MCCGGVVNEAVTVLLIYTCVYTHVCVCVFVSDVHLM